MIIYYGNPARFNQGVFYGIGNVTVYNSYGQGDAPPAAADGGMLIIKRRRR